MISWFFCPDFVKIYANLYYRKLLHVFMFTKTASGLQYKDTVEGTGSQPKVGQKIAVHYTGTFENGTKFDSSHDRKEPLVFIIGVGQVIPGWDEGVLSMKVGGKRSLVIPPELGYGSRPVGPIPANSTLYFDVELIEIK